MMIAGRPAKILLIDSNVYFAKRLSDALKREGFEVTCNTQAAFALTAIEYDAPTAILCATNMREMDALDIARIIRADAKNTNPSRLSPSAMAANVPLWKRSRPAAMTTSTASALPA